MPSSSNRRRPCCFCPTILITTVLAATTATADLWSSDQGKEPRSFNLRDPDHSDAVSAVALGLLQHYPPLSGPASMVDDTKQYFRLLELDGNHLLVGAADAVHNISLQSFERVSIYRWAPEEAEHRECTMKSMDQELCRNFVRVLSRLSGGRLLMCGTNAFAPKCRLLSPRGDIVSEFGAVGLAPFDPAQNSSYVLAQGDDLLYSATVADFAGTDALIFRRNVSEPVEASDRALLRTQRGNPLMLDRPQFVGTLQTEEHVYFFFHEEAAEASAEFRPGAYSRVARVCKSDRGVPRRVAAAEWSTFVKARLNCSVPERNRPFYFDELVSISSSSSSIGNDGTGGEDALIYATFVSEFNFLRHSVICAFRLRHVDELFRNGHYLAYDAVQRKWTRRERDDLTAGLGQCPRQGQKVMSDEEAIAVRKFTLMADALPNAFPGGAVGIHRGADHYSQIAVLPAVPHMDGGFVDVLYVATDHGNVLKMVNLITNMSGTSDHPPAGGTSDRRPHRSRAAAAAAVDDPLRLITVLRLSRQPIRRLLVSAPRFLVVVTDQRVHRVQLQLCELYPTCTLCVAARDPHCAWHHARCRSWQQIKSFDGEQPVQDVLGRKAPEELCRGKETASTPPPSPSTKKVAMATVATAGDEPRGAIEKSANRTTKKGASSSSRKACECPLFSAHQCECPEAEFLLDGMSPPAGGRPPAAPPTQWPTSTDMDSITEGQALPWWVLLLLAIAVLQTIAFVWLCCRLHARRRRQRNAMSSSGKVPLGSTDSGGAVLNTCSAPISAYSAASILINAKQSRTPAGPSIVEQYQQHNNNNKNNSSTTTSGQWTLTSGSGSAASPSVSSNRSSTASSPVVGGGAFAIAGGMGPGLPRTAAMARRASFTGGGYARRSNYADGEISIRLDGVSACGTAMTLPPPSAAPVPPHHLAQLYHQQQLQQRLHSQWPPAMSTFRR